MTMEQWRAIGAVKEVYDGLLFTTHAAAVNLAYPLVSRIREELNNGDRKFMFLCGHITWGLSLCEANYTVKLYRL